MKKGLKCYLKRRIERYKKSFFLYKIIAKRGGGIAKNTKDDLERELGKSVVSSNNSLNYRYSEDNNMIDNK